MKSSRPHTDALGPRLPRVIITGFMGTGKTKTAQALAEILGLECIDSDRLIEQMEGMTVANIFARKGEPHFRRLEEEVCLKLAGRSGVVIATGGGTLVHRKNFDVLSAAGHLVLLEASADAVLKRVGGDGARPLLRGSEGSAPNRAALKERILSILEERRPAYHRISHRVDTSTISPDETAYRIAASMAIASKKVGTAARIEIGRGLVSALGRRLQEMHLDSSVFVLIPENLRERFLAQIAESLNSRSVAWQEVVIRDGDAGKNLDQAGEVLDRLASLGAARDSTIVVVGGGVAGDLGGFVASIYMRGVPLVHVPTTLLAQVDSSIGGKVGVNHPKAKNLIGSFHPPRLVLSDPCVLRTLPAAEISNGMAEVVKTAILGDADLFDFIEGRLTESHPDTLRDVEFLERCVLDSASVKSAITERDPFEKDERRVLNLGHTLGHALEAIGGYRGLTHGQAVSVGLVGAMRIAEARGLVKSTLVERTRNVLANCGLPVDPPPFDDAAFLESLHLDKKKRSGRLHFVLPTGLGSVTVVNDVTEEEARTSLRGERS